MEGVAQDEATVLEGTCAVHEVLEHVLLTVVAADAVPREVGSAHDRRVRGHLDFVCTRNKIQLRLWILFAHETKFNLGSEFCLHTEANKSQKLLL
jgi:hypothetical protein